MCQFIRIQRVHLQTQVTELRYRLKATNPGRKAVLFKQMHEDQLVIAGKRSIMTSACSKNLSWKTGMKRWSVMSGLPSALLFPDIQRNLAFFFFFFKFRYALLQPQGHNNNRLDLGLSEHALYTAFQPTLSSSLSQCSTLGNNLTLSHSIQEIATMFTATPIKYWLHIGLAFWHVHCLCTMKGDKTTTHNFETLLLYLGYL